MTIPYVSYYDNVLPAELCQKIIDRFESNPQMQESTVLDDHRSFTEINITKHKEWEDVQDTLLNTMQYYLGRYMQQFKIDPKCWPKEVGYEMFRMKRYLPNDHDEFKFHVDVENYDSARRFLVFFFYLNDVAEGGETAFQQNRNTEIELKVKPVQGRLLVFPPLWTHPHIGMKPISGPKYILGSYLHYV
jgi:hypothetical protein